MNKPVALIMAPVATVSGYGARSRDIAYSLIKSGKYEVKIWNTRWGATPMNALDSNNPKHKAIMDCLMTEPQLAKQPELFVQVTVPNEFQRLGMYNIGVTAGIETTIASAAWIEGCNNMDLVLVSSEHAKTVFEQSVWQKMNQQTNQPEGELKLTTKMEVLFEGVDLDVYHQTNEIDKTIVDALKDVKEDFAYLFVGHWMNGDMGEDRKNVSGLVRTFFEAFKNKAPHNQPALILKSSAADFSTIDRDMILNKIEMIRNMMNTKALPNVYLIHGDLTDSEINSLYNHPKVKAHVTFTKGEGYGRPLAEASLSQKPIIAPNWSGHVDFLKEAVLLPGSLTQVHPSVVWENVIIPESQWFTVDYGYAVGVLRTVFDKYKDYKDLGKKQAFNVKKNYNLLAMEEKFSYILETYAAEATKSIATKMPTLKKLDLPTLQTNK